MDSQVRTFVARRWGVTGHRLRIDVQPLTGGLESSVTLARIHGRDCSRSVPRQVVVKELRPGFEREAEVYELLWTHLAPPPAVRLLGSESKGGAMYLYLEDAQPSSQWPWSDVQSAAAVCRALARLHDSATLPPERFSWNYEAQLARSADQTLQLARAARRPDGRRHWRRLGDLRRVVAGLPAIRSRLLSGRTTVIHGDVHPGNVMLRASEPAPEVVLIDWGRARIGSPLEDVASWLHSLGCWEPLARRRHDTLMQAYLVASGMARRLAEDVRVDYWLASASNGLSGAIRYHLAVLADPASGDEARGNSWCATVAWERVVRRAAALLRTSLAR